MANTQEKTLREFDKLPEKFTWSDLSKDYQAFTPALLYWHTGFDRDVVSDYVDQFVTSREDVPKMCISPVPIFTMEDPMLHLKVRTSTGDKLSCIDLSRTLYFCPRSIWDKPETGLKYWLGGIGFVDPASKGYAISLRCPSMPVLDRMREAQCLFPPLTISIESYGLYDTVQCNVWRYNIDNAFERPKACRLNACDLIVQDGEVFWKEH